MEGQSLEDVTLLSVEASDAHFSKGAERSALWFRGLVVIRKGRCVSQGVKGERHGSPLSVDYIHADTERNQPPPTPPPCLEEKAGRKSVKTFIQVLFR